MGTRIGISWPRGRARVPADLEAASAERPGHGESPEHHPHAATVLIMTRLDGHPSDLVVALLPGLVRTMLAAFVEAMMAEQG